MSNVRGKSRACSTPYYIYAFTRGSRSLSLASPRADSSPSFVGLIVPLALTIRRAVATCRAGGGVYVADSHRFIADRSYVQGGRDDGDIGGAAFQAVTEGIVRLSGGNKLPPGYPGVAFQANVAEGNDSVG